ncbi:MAG: hypothetical protein QOF70_2477 [Acetobacteraceae bacterium]|nr:hypothetical protein [Acetobacteraceae bacterium]
MNIKHNNSIVPTRLQPRGIRLHATSARNLLAGFKTTAVGLLTSVALVGHAVAQAATPSTAGIGAQVQQMAQEGSTTGGFVGSTAMYVCALICMVGGAWALWQSRQPQNRESGRVAMGLAGLVLAGLFATGGSWINKAANSTSGANATITSTSGTVAFGTGG